LAVVFVLLLPWRPAASAADWTPEMWVDENTLELRTTEPGEEPHWSPVWVAVVDGQLYVRLGDRAAGRVERNVDNPHLGLRIAGQEFPHVRGEPAPEMASRVAAEIKEKYWSDVFIRFFPHPLTLRLVRDDEPGQSDD
jgi:hypothetical protein